MVCVHFGATLGAGQVEREPGIISLWGVDGRGIPTTSVASLMSAHFAVESQISRNRTWAASLRALASSSEPIVKRSTTSSLYRETIVPGGFESATDRALPTS